MPRLVKAVSKPAEAPAPRPAAPNAGERPRLVKAAPKPAEQAANDAPVETAAPETQSGEPARRRRRRRGGARRRKPAGEGGAPAPASED